MSQDKNTTEEPIEQQIFHLDLHAVIEAQQAAHGVRHDDFAQYHGYCTRRLCRLSHLKDVKKHLVCSAKYATVKPEGTNNKARHAYCSRLADTFQSNHVPHINVLLYLLVQSERAWAQANQYSKESQKRQLILKKFKRASGWAEKLLQKAQVACDPTSIQECQAYASWMKANYALEQLDYATASQEFAQAMRLCHQLGQHDDNATLDPAKRLERQDLFMTRADTVIKPLFRYCQYELQQAGLPLLVEEPRLDSSSSPKSKEDDTTSTTIQFRGQHLALDSKELRVLWLKWQSLASVHEGDETAFLNRLSVLDDALEVVQTQFQTLEQAQAGPAVQAKRQHNRLWKGYLQSLKTQQVMDHTSNLLHTITGHAERVHIYDALLQHAKSLLQIPRAPDQNEDDEFALQAQANILRLRALKTYHMAWHYYQESRNYKAAWALMQHSAVLCKRAGEEIAACDEDMPHSQEYLEQLESLPLSSLKVAIQAALHLQGSSTTERLVTQRPLLLRLNEPDEGTVLAGGLTYMPIPCKPVFYDIAMDYSLDTATSLDLLQSYLDQHVTSPDPEPTATATTTTSKGFFGWLTG